MTKNIHVIILEASLFLPRSIKLEVVILIRAYASVVIILSLGNRESSDRLLSAITHFILLN